MQLSTSLVSAVVVCALSCLLLAAPGSAAPADGCRPEFFDQLPLRTQDICTKILALREVQRAMEDYLEDEREYTRAEERTHAENTLTRTDDVVF